MFTKRITLFTLLGFEVRVDLSWILLAILITWTLAAGVFPAYYPDLPRATYWAMGVIGALGLFFSIIFHEMSHSLVARHYGLPMGGITLFLFGGVAEMTDEPESPRIEFMMAIAGPIASIVLGLAFYAIEAGATVLGAPPSVVGVFFYLGLINIVLAVFNMVPAFPLDGGRVLRAILWHWKGDLRQATRTASNFGSGFGILLIVLGLLNIIQGNFVGGMWWFLIGLFVRGAAAMSYQQVLINQGFEGVPVRRIMNSDPVAVPPGISVAELVDDYFYRYHYKTYPVAQDGKLLGYVATRNVKEVPRERWSFVTVGSIMSKLTDENTVSPNMDALKAMRLMNQTGNSRLLVAEGNQLLGIVSLKDMTNFLFLKMELEGEETQNLPRVGPG